MAHKTALYMTVTSLGKPCVVGSIPTLPTKGKKFLKKPFPILSARMKTPRQRVTSEGGAVGSATKLFCYSFYPFFNLIKSSIA